MCENVSEDMDHIIGLAIGLLIIVVKAFLSPFESVSMTCLKSGGQMETNNKKEHCLEIRKAVKSKGAGQCATNAQHMKTQKCNRGAEFSI